MPLYRLVPIARPDDSRWQDRPIWREVVVRADSPALARVVAADLDRPVERPTSVGNETLGFMSGFDDEKLYWVQALPESEAAGLDPQGPPAVLRSERLPRPSPFL